MSIFNFLWFVKQGFVWSLFGDRSEVRRGGRGCMDGLILGMCYM